MTIFSRCGGGGFLGGEGRKLRHEKGKKVFFRGKKCAAWGGGGEGRRDGGFIGGEIVLFLGGIHFFSIAIIGKKGGFWRGRWRFIFWRGNSFFLSGIEGFLEGESGFFVRIGN